MQEKPLSEQIANYDGGKYHITAAIWRTLFAGQSYDTFEIGIREKATGDFVLLQSDKYNYQSVQEVANAIAHLLSIPGEAYSPEWVLEYLT